MRTIFKKKYENDNAFKDLPQFGRLWKIAISVYRLIKKKGVHDPHKKLLQRSVIY